MINRIGHRYNKLRVLAFDSKDARHHLFWLCECDCGKKAVVSGNHLRTGHTKSCGCQKAISRRNRPERRFETVSDWLEALKVEFQYDSATGIVRNKNGRLVGSPNADGYISISFGRRKILRHRLGWLLTYGYLPKEVDHKDRTPGNDWIDNLRVASRSQNNANAKVRSNSRTQIKGVFQIAGSKRFYARIKKDGVTHSLGGYVTAEQAANAYHNAAVRLYGDFARAS